MTNIDALYGTFAPSAQEAADMRAYEDWRARAAADGFTEAQMYLEAYADWWAAQNEPEEN